MNETKIPNQSATKMEQQQQGGRKRTAAPFFVGYAISSGLLSIINKYALLHFPYPTLLTALQYATTAAGVWILGKMGLLNHDPITCKNARNFFPVALMFYLCIFANTNLLKHANVDTFIVFKSASPLLVAAADALFRKQGCPSASTFGSLVVILLGAIGYVLCDSAISIRAYSWALIYLFVITSDMVYIKHLVSRLELNTWGLVFYNNTISCLMAPIFWILTGDYEVLVSVFERLSTRKADLVMGFRDEINLMSFSASAAIFLSCSVGLFLSFFGFATRRAVSATAFSVAGVVSKLLTIIVNVLIWDRHASAGGLMFLLVIIFGGLLYQHSTSIAPPFKNLQIESSCKLISGPPCKQIAVDSDLEKPLLLSS